MKGYITNGVCYIFPQEAAQIPEVEADVFYVQQEDYVAWLAANESLADKLVKYNYNLLAVRPKPFAGHTDDDLEPAQKEDPELAWSEDSATVTIGADDNVFPTLTNPHSVTVSYSSSDSEKASIDASTGEVTLVAEGDTTISAVFAGDDTYEAQTVTYTLTVQAAQAQTYSVTVTTEQDFPAQGLSYGPTDYEENDEVNIVFENSNLSESSDYEIVCSDAGLGFSMEWYWQEEVTDETTGEPTGETIDHWPTLIFTMPAENITFTLQSIEGHYITWSDDYSSLVSNASLSFAHVDDALAFDALENVDLYNDYTCSVIDSNSDPVTLDGPTSDYNALAFKMPASDVTITISPKNL